MLELTTALLAARLDCRGEAKSSMSAGHWTILDVKKEIELLESLQAARPSLQMDGLLTTLGNKLVALMPMDTTTLLDMYEYLRKCKLPQDVVDGLCQVLDGNHANQATNAALVQQHCDVGKYLTQSEYESLQQEDMWMGAQTLANRLRLLGLKSMKETTKKLATALLLWFHFKRTKQIPQGDIAYVLSHHLSQCFLSSTVEVGENAESLLVYPENPGDLKKSHLDAAYGDERPQRRSYPELAKILKFHSPIRSSSGLVTSKVSWFQLHLVFWFLLFCFYLVLEFQCFLFFCFCTANGPEAPPKASFQAASSSSMDGPGDVPHDEVPDGTKVGRAVMQWLGQAVAQQAAPLHAQYLPKAKHGLVAPSLPMQLAGITSPLALPVHQPHGAPFVGLPAHQPHGAPSPLALPAHQPHGAPSALALPAHQPQAQAATNEETVPPPVTGPPETEGQENDAKGLEQYEQEAFQALKDRQETKPMKRPCSAKGKAKPACKHPPPSKKPQGVSKTKEAPKLKLGCRKCRGCSNGCAQCRSPSYSGIRMNREEWLAFSKKHGLK